MSLISINNLTFAYDGSYDTIFKNVSFQMDTNWKLGFTGRNGRGKTTFLNLLLGKYSYEGQISSKVTFSYFPFTPQTADDINRLTLDIVDQIVPNYEYWQLSRELNYLETSDDILYRPYTSLSGGEKAKVQLAALFLREDGFLLIDEPTNHLDMHGREILAKYLQKKRGFILVSHDRLFLDACVDHILSINKTNIEIQKGNFSSWLYNKDLQDRYEMAENEKLTRQIKSMEAAARRTAAWSDTIEKRKTGGTGGQAGVKPDKGHILDSADSTAFPVFNKKSFTVKRGDRIALQGPNGCGKSSILKLILQAAESTFAAVTDEAPVSLPEFTGNLHVGSGLVISYVPQTTAGLCGTLDTYASRRSIDITLLKTILRKLDFSRLQFEKNIEDYSEGQKKKVLLAASLCENAHLYIWDEPLNYIDVLSRMQIENLLLQFQPTMIFVEHDKAFCDNVATETVLL